MEMRVQRIIDRLQKLLNIRITVVELDPSFEETFEFTREPSNDLRAEHPACAVCGCCEGVLIHYVPAREYWKCGACGHMWASPLRLSATDRDQGPRRRRGDGGNTA
jgi:hypothetical protein